MKRKFTAVLLCLILVICILSGCSAGTSTDDTLYGEITEISDTSITIEVGTMKEMSDGDAPSDTSDNENTDENSSDSTSDSSSESAESTEADSENAEDGGENQPDNSGDMSMLELTGETQIITITDSTVFKSQSMGGQPSGGEPSDISGDGEEPPEKPDGDDSSDSGEEPPEKPDGEDSSDGAESADSTGSSDGDSSSENQPSEESEEISISDLSVGDTISVTFDDDGNAAEITLMSASAGGEGGTGGQSSSSPESYDAVTEYTSDTEVDGESFESTGTDENAIHVYNDAVVILKNIAVSRISSDSEGGDNSSFYGVGAAILSTDSTVYISNSTIETDADGGAGIFAYNDGTVYTSDTKITTQQDTSGGIHVAGGGTLYAWDMTIETNGESSAAIRSDRGGGTMVVDGGTYTSNGVGSPAIYSTADITVNNATLTANSSEAICIEGLNSIRLFNSNLTGNMSDDSQNDCTWNVILYQSMSGDSEVGNSTFEMSGGTLTAKNGGMFYTTNTESTFVLSDVDITYADENDFFLKCTGNDNERGWGTSGSNGADCSFTAINQEMQGDIIWDSISNLDFYMTDGSTLTGAVIDDESYAGDGGDGYCNVYIDDDCTWIVTGDSTITNLYSKGTIVDESGKTVTVVGTDSTVYVEGDSSYTVTVESYSTDVDLSNASELSDWSEYEVEKPSQLS
ncbi:MAG: hypothetical protein LIO62_01575 [Clostridiales bacterium]|nr:hypothetical protein [Clostridiales bacterium]